MSARQPLPTRSESRYTNGVEKGDADGKADGSTADNGGGRLHPMMIVVFVSLILDLLAFTVILPLLPALLDYYGTQDQGGLYGLIKDSVNGFRQLVGAPDTPRWTSVLFGGLIGSLFSLLQFLASPLIGAASDVYGRRPLMLLSMVGVALSYALWAVSHNFTLFVLARIVGGISKGNVSLSTAIVADVLPQEKRGKGMALIGVAFSVGFVLGPMIGAGFSVMKDSMGQFYVAPALFALTLAVIDIVFLYVAFKETLPADRRAPSLISGVQEAVYLISPPALFKFSAVKGIAPTELKPLQDIGWVYFLYLFLYSGLEFTLTFLTHNRFNYGSMQQGKMFLFLGIIMIVLQGGYVRRLTRGTEQKLALRGMMLLIPAFILIGLSYNTTLLYLGLAMFAFASATVVPCVTTLVSNFGSVEQKGTVMGIFRSLGALARAFGPMVASTVYWSCGPEVCYIAGGVALVIPLILLQKLKVKQAD